MIITDKLARYSSDLKNNIWANENNEVLEAYYSKICDIADIVSEQCLQHECNIPESNSAIERWEAVQYRLEEKYEQIQSLCDDFLDIITALSNITDNNMNILSERIDNLIDNMIEYNSQYRGFSRVGR